METWGARSQNACFFFALPTSTLQMQRQQQTMENGKGAGHGGKTAISNTDQ